MASCRSGRGLFERFPTIYIYIGLRRNMVKRSTEVSSTVTVIPMTDLRKTRSSQSHKPFGQIPENPLSSVADPNLLGSPCHPQRCRRFGKVTARSCEACVLWSTTDAEVIGRIRGDNLAEALRLICAGAGPCPGVEISGVSTSGVHDHSSLVACSNRSQIHVNVATTQVAYYLHLKASKTSPTAASTSTLKLPTMRRVKETTIRP